MASIIWTAPFHFLTKPLFFREVFVYNCLSEQEMDQLGVTFLVNWVPLLKPPNNLLVPAMPDEKSHHCHCGKGENMMGNVILGTQKIKHFKYL